MTLHELSTCRSSPMTSQRSCPAGVHRGGRCLSIACSSASMATFKLSGETVIIRFDPEHDERELVVRPRTHERTLENHAGHTSVRAQTSFIRNHMRDTFGNKVATSSLTAAGCIVEGTGPDLEVSCTKAIRIHSRNSARRTRAPVHGSDRTT